MRKSLIKATSLCGLMVIALCEVNACELDCWTPSINRNVYAAIVNGTVVSTKKLGKSRMDNGRSDLYVGRLKVEGTKKGMKLSAGTVLNVYYVVFRSDFKPKPKRAELHEGDSGTFYLRPISGIIKTDLDTLKIDTTSRDFYIAFASAVDVQVTFDLVIKKNDAEKNNFKFANMDNYFGRIQMSKHLYSTFYIGDSFVIRMAELKSQLTHIINSDLVNDKGKKVKVGELVQVCNMKRRDTLDEGKYTLRKQRDLNEGGNEGTASLSLKEILTVGGVAQAVYIVDLVFTNRGPGRIFYNPIFDELIPLPGELAVYNADKVYLGSLLPRETVSHKTVGSSDWQNIAPDASVKAQFTLNGSCDFLGLTKLPPGKYYLQMIYYREYINANPFLIVQGQIQSKKAIIQSFHKNFNRQELFRSNAVEMTIEGSKKRAITIKPEFGRAKTLSSRKGEKLTMTLAWVADAGKPNQYVFVINGIVAYRTLDGLKKYLRDLPRDSVLTWSPECCRKGDEPLLGSKEEMKRFREFCESIGVKFVLVPSG